MVSDKSMANLKPFTGANDPRRQNGRKKGQINRRTAIRELLAQEVDPRLLLDDKARKKAEGLKGQTYLEAILHTLANQAIGEDTRASDLLLRELRHVEHEDPGEQPLRQGIKIEVVQSRDEIERLESLRDELKATYGDNYEQMV